jgi:Ca2+-transporting ATPase
MPVQSPDILDLSGFAGLSEAEAARRLEVDAPNELPSSKPRGILAIAAEVAREPMFVLLVAAGSLYLAMGELGDALMLLGFVFVVMGITVVQERRTERALDALRDLSSPRALVVRAGQRRRIAGREVVRGDVLLIAEGDRVPADALLRQAMNLSTDESLLTGESVPVRKIAAADAQELPRPGGDDLPALFAGTLVTSGQGVAEVIVTGVRTELGRIGKALQQTESETTPLQKETGRIVRTLAVAGLAACAAVVIAYSLTRGGSWQVWKQGLLAGISMAMALLPEEFPVVLTVFLALGAWRISRSHVLTRRMPAIETLGAATVLCVDKTGTLTQNQMGLKCLATEDQTFELDATGETLPEELRLLLQTAVLASKPDPFDPMERAVHSAAQRWLSAEQLPGRDWQIEREYPLTAQLLVVTHGWQRGRERALVIASKGAPEAVAELCRLAPERRTRIERAARTLAAQGLRVLGVARGELEDGALPPEHRSLTPEFLGLIAFEDPLRSTVPAAVAECRSAGIRVVMITGDYPETARSIARQAGLFGPGAGAGAHDAADEAADDGAIITGQQLAAMSDAELARRIRDTRIFARVVPEQKLRIVTALKADGEVVAMTGDGVNDAPALKAAHIGIAMGGRGSDVAREAAALVLLDDDFSSIVAAVKLGRRIYDNIKKAISFILAVHVPIAGLSIAPVFFPSWPLLLLPVHIVFLELIIDPSCSLVFEAEEAEADVMQRPPRPAAERLFSRRTVTLSLAQGLSVLLVCLGVVLLARPARGPDVARTLSFATLVISFLTVILINRSRTQSAVGMMRARNPALWWILTGTAMFLGAVLCVPALQRLFLFAPLHASDLAVSVGAGIGCLLWFDLLKPRVPTARIRWSRTAR